MLDIIIPSYNDLTGLCHSLNSFGPYIDLSKIHLYIIDDASTLITHDDYSALSKHYAYLNPTILYLSTNHGPGYARQYGIEHTTAPYLFFLDCGNLLASPLIIENLISSIQQYPQIDFFAMNYLMEKADHTFTECKRTSEFHGALLKRQFLKDYNLQIPTVYSYSLEDTTFFCCIHKITRFLGTYMFLETIPVIRTYNTNSLTNKENQDFYYKYLIPGYLYNTLQLYHTIQVPPQFNKREILLNLLAALFYMLKSVQNYNIVYFEEYIQDVHLFFETYLYPLEEEDYNVIFTNIIKLAPEFLEECLLTKYIPNIDIQNFLEWCNMPLNLQTLPERWILYGS